MRNLAIAFAVLAVAAFAGVLVLAQIAGGSGAGPSPWALYLDSGPLEKLTDMLLVAGAVAIAVVGLVRDGHGNRSAAAALPYFASAALAVGVLAALQGALRTWTVASRVHVTNFMVVAPSLAEAMIPLSVGLLCAAFGFGLARSRRAEPGPTPA
jgi:uncharacterized membrane protein